jgi:hypothetical protein
MALQLVQVPPLKLSVPTPALVSVNAVSVVKPKQGEYALHSTGPG